MTPGPKQLVLISTSKGKVMLCMWQLFQQCVEGHALYSSFQSKVTIYNNRKQLQLVQHADRRMLLRLGAISAKAQKVGIITCKVAYNAMQACGVPLTTLQAIKAISTMPASLTVLPLPRHVMQPCAQPSTNPDQLQMMGPLPINIPEYPLSEDPMAHKKYGLKFTQPSLAAMRPLSLQLWELKEFCMQPVQLDRPFGSHSSATWATQMATFLCSLGIETGEKRSNSPLCNTSSAQIC